MPELNTPNPCQVVAMAMHGNVNAVTMGPPSASEVDLFADQVELLQDELTDCRDKYGER